MAFFGRGKNKIKKPYTFAIMYKEYIKDKEPNSPYNIPYIIYANICSDYYKHLKDVILTGRIVKLRLCMGELAVKKRIKKGFRLSPDWVKSVFYGKKIFHTNDHSRQYSYKFMWNILKTKVLFNYTYLFVPCRAAKRELAKFIKQEKYDYFEYK